MSNRTVNRLATPVLGFSTPGVPTSRTAAGMSASFETTRRRPIGTPCCSKRRIISCLSRQTAAVSLSMPGTPWRSTSAAWLRRHDSLQLTTPSASVRCAVAASTSSGSVGFAAIRSSTPVESCGSRGAIRVTPMPSDRASV